MASSIDSLGHKLDNLLLDQPFVAGWAPSSLDDQLFQQLGNPTPDLPNLKRWANNLRSYSDKGKLKSFKQGFKLFFLPLTIYEWTRHSRIPVIYFIILFFPNSHILTNPLLAIPPYV